VSNQGLFKISEEVRDGTPYLSPVLYQHIIFMSCTMPDLLHY